MMQLKRRKAVGWVLGAMLCTFLGQALLCYFFSGGELIPRTLDINPANYRQLQLHFPPRAVYNYEYWLGFPGATPIFSPLSILAHLSPWWFFTCYYPLCAALSVGTFYALMREFKVSGSLSLWGGLVYGWQGPLLSNILPGHFNPAMLWVIFPLALVWANRCGKERSWWAAGLAGALCGWMVALSPDRGALSCLLVAAFYWWSLLGIWTESRPWAELAHRAVRFLFLVLVAWIVAWPVLASIVSENIDSQKSTASSSQEKFEWATQWSYPPEDYLNYLAPGALGWFTGSGKGEYWGRIGRSEEWNRNGEGFRNFMLDTFTIGTMPTALGLLEIFCSFAMLFLWVKKRAGKETVSVSNSDRFSLFFSAGFLLCAILALGKYFDFYPLLLRLPYMDTWRNPLKFLTPGNICLVILAVLGLQRWCQNHEKVILISARRILGTVIGGIFVLALVTSFLLVPFLLEEKYTADEANQAVKGLILSLLGASLVLVLTRFAIRRYTHSPGGLFPRPPAVNPGIARLKKWTSQPGNRVPVLAVVLGVLTVAQMFWVHRHFLQPLAFRSYYASNPLLEDLQRDPRPFRVKLFQNDPALNQYLSDYFPYHHVQCLDIPAASRVPEDYEAFFNHFREHPLRLWQLTGARYVIFPGPMMSSLQALPGFEMNVQARHFYRVEGSELRKLLWKRAAEKTPFTHVMMELKNPLEKVVVVPKVEWISERAEALSRMTSPDFDPRQTVLIARSDSGPAPEIRPVGGTGRAEMRNYEAGRMQIKTYLQAPGTIVVSDHFERGWRATVNGQSAPIFRANYLMMAIPVPAGESEIELRFGEATTGVNASMSVWVLLGLAWLGRRYRLRNPFVRME